MSIFNAVHHIAIIGTDYNKSKFFYVTMLGFEVIRENYRKKTDDYKIDLKLGELEIELFIKKTSPARLSNPESTGLRHIAFKVANISETIEKLNSLGIDTEPVRRDDYTGERMTFFRDPDNMPIEIHE